MELVKNRWSVNQDEVNRLGALPKKELMDIIKAKKLGTGTLSRKRLEKETYDTIKAATKSKKAKPKRTSKRSKSDNS